MGNFQMRASDEEVAEWDRAAAADGRSRTNWIRRVLNDASNAGVGSVLRPGARGGRSQHRRAGGGEDASARSHEDERTRGPGGDSGPEKRERASEIAARAPGVQTGAQFLR